ncbi:hypothetical protein EDC61_102169 [Sulfuritortus calidifontis]|uniref:Uncharacterized protein n=1 Tax=Sulfuritortus calidifontis TaxID=1914471 RepID=A0A4R3JY01_9PROT|nr:hypothetical protein EDC61_102169 [Sulfuritortus calidifontis]
MDKGRAKNIRLALLLALIPLALFVLTLLGFVK